MANTGSGKGQLRILYIGRPVDKLGGATLTLSLQPKSLLLISLLDGDLFKVSGLHRHVLHLATFEHECLQTREWEVSRWMIHRGREKGKGARGKVMGK